ncbi:MFS transporter [Acinetobacter larvae]|uniref:ABC transporter permease n=1 Tax=Acinetobacter larvae TaxID=1789224 RepID=A0A1B2M3K7_9GAMM|nr:MFS transporter [Acinetobacter larvae]AOA59786.1 ABC transporter permease [Acinetobacter larvae]
MLHRYTALFSVKGTLGFTLAGLLARMALPMTGIAMITMLSQQYGRYALAGAVSATFVLAYALLSPQISRLVDRYGQYRILMISALLSVFGTSLILLCSYWQLGQWLLFVGAIFTGCMPSLSAMLRARWTQIYRGQPELATAYSLESVLDELSFIVGPPLAVGLSVAWFVQAGPLLAAIFLISGIIFLALQRNTEPKIDSAQQAQHTTAIIRQVDVLLLALLMLAMGVIVGTIDIMSVAFAESLQQTAAASWVLSAYALSSCVAGLIFGATNLRMPLHRLLLCGGIATAITTLPLLWANSIVALLLMVFVAGIFFAPTMIIAMTLIERMVPASRLTEGMTWLLAALSIGVALGAAITGQVVDAMGIDVGFRVAVVAGILVILAVCLGYQRLGKYQRCEPS